MSIAVKEISLLFVLFFYIDVICPPVFGEVKAYHEVVMQQFVDFLCVQEPQVLYIKQVSDKHASRIRLVRFLELLG